MTPARRWASIFQPPPCTAPGSSSLEFGGAVSERHRQREMDGADIVGAGGGARACASSAYAAQRQPQRAHPGLHAARTAPRPSGATAIAYPVAMLAAAMFTARRAGRPSGLAPALRQRPQGRMSRAARGHDRGGAPRQPLRSRLGRSVDGSWSVEEFSMSASPASWAARGLVVQLELAMIRTIISTQGNGGPRCGPSRWNGERS